MPLWSLVCETTTHRAHQRPSAAATCAYSARRHIIDRGPVRQMEVQLYRQVRAPARPQSTADGCEYIHCKHPSMVARWRCVRDCIKELLQKLSSPSADLCQLCQLAGNLRLSSGLLRKFAVRVFNLLYVEVEEGPCCTCSPLP